MDRTGRPALPLERSIVQRVAERLAKGIPTVQACAMEDGLSVQKWEAACEDPRILSIVHAAQGQLCEFLFNGVSGQRALELLERLWPERYARPEPKQHVELSGGVLIFGQTPEELARKAADRAKRRAKDRQTVRS